MSTESREAWMDLAACRDVDPELFFPIGTSGPAARQIRVAQAVCARCPVASDCLDCAQRMGLGHGVWGGTTPDERQALRQSNPSRPSATP